MSGGLERRVERAMAAMNGGQHLDARRSPTAYEHDGNIVRFAADGLGLDLFPLQATLLKVLSCSEHLFTAFDDDALAEWSTGFRAVQSADGVYFEGQRGTTPDVVECMRYCHGQGRTTFREITLVGGRRSSKTFIAAVLLLWHVSELLGLDDPQAARDLPAGKVVLFVAMSTNKDTVSRDMFSDVASMARAGSTFDGFVEHIGTDEIRFWTPAQVAAGARQRREHGLIVVSALPTTSSAGRGPALDGFVLDELGHYAGRGSTSTATDIHRALVPAMAQFPNSFAMLCSSPWTKTDRLYEAHRAACAVDPTTGLANHMDTITMQFPSWELYRHWEQASSIEMWPGGPTFRARAKPVISIDSRSCKLGGNVTTPATSSSTRRNGRLSPIVTFRLRPSTRSSKPSPWYARKISSHWEFHGVTPSTSTCRCPATTRRWRWATCATWTTRPTSSSITSSHGDPVTTRPARWTTTRSPPPPSS